MILFEIEIKWIFCVWSKLPRPKQLKNDKKLTAIKQFYSRRKYFHRRHPCSLVVFEQRRLRQVCCCGCVLMSPTATDTGGSQCVPSVLAYFLVFLWLVQNIEIGFVNVNLYRSEEKSHFDIQEWGGWQNDDLIQNCTDCVVVAEMPEDTLKTHRVGSRKSELALIQTRFVISELEKLCPGHSFTIVEVTVVKSSS